MVDGEARYSMMQYKRKAEICLVLLQYCFFVVLSTDLHMKMMDIVVGRRQRCCLTAMFHPSPLSRLGTGTVRMQYSVRILIGREQPRSSCGSVTHSQQTFDASDTNEKETNNLHPYYL